MENGRYGYVRGWMEDNNTQGYWDITIKNIGERAFVLTTARWPDWCMTMQDNAKGWVAGSKGKQGPEGQIKLLDANSGVNC